MSKKKPYSAAISLWLTPDFTDVFKGKAMPPRVDHSIVDFGALKALLERTFTFGPNVDIFVPNDTIDQVTMTLRAGHFEGSEFIQENLDAARCRDFGYSMIKCIGNAKDGIIDVRKAWKTLHAEPVADRTFAPPPSILPFVITCDDFEDSALWQNHARPRIGLPIFDIGKWSEGIEQNESEGTMSDDFNKSLKSIFGCPFEKRIMMERMAPILE